MTQYIENVSALESIFGRWPSFHDAEVLRVVLDRSGDDGPTLYTTIHLFEMTSEVDAKGYFVLKNHTEVELMFTTVELIRLQGFNNQNVISTLKINPTEPRNAGSRRLRVELSSSYGLETVFECERAVVSEVKPYVKHAV